MPPWRSFASVRARTKIQSAHGPKVVHTFWPFSTKWSPSSRAAVLSAARSLPAPGSLKPWHQISSPESMGGMKRRRCASLPWWMSAGPRSPMPRMFRMGGASARASSASMIDFSTSVPPRPPHCSGQSMPR